MRSELLLAAKGLSSVRVQEYLRSRDWSLARDLSDRIGIMVYAKEEFEAEIPQRREFVDYARRMAEALEVIADAEATDVSNLIEALERPDGDGLAVRLAEGHAASGTLPLLDSLRVREATKNLLLAAAHSVHSPQAFFPRMARASAVELIASVREAPSQRGSFISRFIVPTDPAVGEQMSLEDPFSRTVVRTLMHALDEVQRTRSRGELDPLLSMEKSGVSANLLSALAAFKPAMGGGTLEIAVTWSRNRPVPSNPISRVCFPEESLDGLDAVADAMRAQAKSKGFEVVGYITHLERDPPEPDAGGKVVIVSHDPGTDLKRVHVELDPAPYRDATTAHREGHEVRVVGTLEKSGRRWILSDPSGFEVLRSPSEDSLGV